MRKQKQLKESGISGTRRTVSHAAIKCRENLKVRAEILLQAIECQILGVPNNSRIKLVLSSVVQLTTLHEISKLKFALREISELNDKRTDITIDKVNHALGVANTSINNNFTESYDIAVAAIIAMNLSTARTTTLINIVQTMQNSNKISAIEVYTKAATDTAETVSSAILNRISNKITNHLTELTDKFKQLKNAIVEELK
jgi:hypothetical protein